MLIADLFIMVPKWKQAKCPLKGEWVKSWVFIQRIHKYYSIHSNFFFLRINYCCINMHIFQRHCIEQKKQNIKELIRLCVEEQVKTNL